MRRTTRIASALSAVLVVGVVGLAAHHAVAAAELPVAAVTASGDDGNEPANAIDNDLSTRWSDEGDGVWIRFDLGASTTVGSVAIAWYKGDQRQSTFEVQTSTNGSTWTTVVSRRDSSGDTTAPVTSNFTDRSARYVRVLGYGNDDNDWTSITEVDIFGADGGTTPPTGTPTAGPTTSPPGGCSRPAQVLNLTNWKITLPIDDPGQSGTQPLEIRQPALNSYSIDPWFKVNSNCTGVQFRNAVNGAHTPNSSYARSELREMTSNGTANAAWSSTSGTHTMVISQAITHLPNDKPHVVAGQIHDGSDDVQVFRLEGSSLYLTNGDDTHYKLITSSYTLGTRFEAKFVVSGGQIRAYYNGVLQSTLPTSFSGAYFKAGAYTQANCTNSSPCGTSNYGEVIVYSVSVTHS